MAKTATNLYLDEALVPLAKEYAKHSKRSLSELVEDCLTSRLRNAKKAMARPTSRLPQWAPAAA